MTAANLALDLDDPKHRRALRALLDELDTGKAKPDPTPGEPAPVDDVTRARVRRELREKGIT